MKKLRIASVVILVIAVALAVFFKVKDVAGGDKLAPMVNAPEEMLEVSIHDDTSVLLTDVTANDVRDGDVSDTLVVENVSTFLEGNRRIVTYAAFDKDNNVGKATRQIHYTDYMSPRFTLDKPFVYTMNSNSGSLESLHAEDCIDGDISDRIRFSKGQYLYADSFGEVPIQLEVSNSIGDTVTLPITITIYDPSEYNMLPQIELTDYLVYTTVGQSLDLEGYLDQAAYRGQDLTEDVTVDGSAVDFNTPGVYEAVYSVTNEDEYTGKMRLIIIVTES